MFRLHSALNVMPDDPGEKLAYKAVMIIIIDEVSHVQIRGSCINGIILRKLTYLASIKNVNNN